MTKEDQLLDLLETAWGIIANASGGDWERESPEWQAAAGRFRDQYHQQLRTELSASEALFGFAGWLTTRRELVTLGATENAAPAAELVALFCKTNRLADPREGWSDRLVHPK